METTVIDNPITWPDGARCAVAFTFDVDVDSSIHLNFGQAANSKVCASSMVRFEIEIGIPRIVALFRRIGIQQTFFVPGWCIDQYPKMAQHLADEGHEIGHHGYMHEKMNLLTAAEEREALQKGIASIVNLTGQRPKGYRVPSYAFSKDTLGMLIDEGFVYDSSLLGGELPYILETNKKRLIELPVDTALDDWNQFVSFRDFGQIMPIASPQAGFEVYKAEFDAAWKYGVPWITVWHPFVTGRLARFDAMVELIQYMKAKGDVWFATLGEIAKHVEDCQAKGWQPRIDHLPFRGQ